MPLLGTVLDGPSSRAESDTIRRAIEIEDGRVRNEAILRFQGRSSEYPYPSM
jgi:hypothetical protein